MPDLPAGFGGFRNGSYDAGINAATADVAFHGANDFARGGIGVLPQEGDAGHDHATGAVAALHRADFHERFLEGMQLAVLIQPFDGGDFFAGDRADGCDARAGGCSIDQHRARAALAFAAAVLGAG